MRRDYSRLIPILKSMAPPRRLAVLGRMVGFIRRLREVRAGLFVWAAVLSRFSDGRPGFEEVRRWYHRLSGKLVAYRAFHLRFKTEEVVELFARTFDEMVSPWRATTRRPDHPIAKCFPDVVVCDSTVLQVADRLRTWFPGLRGIPAGIKVCLAVSLYGLVPLWASIVAATRNDAQLFPRLDQFRRGTLFLFDLAFVVYDRLREIVTSGHTYVCRLRKDGNPLVLAAPYAPAWVAALLRGNPDGVPLRDLLPSDKKIGRVWELVVWLRPDEDRANRVLARLVIVPGPHAGQRAYLTNLDARRWPSQAIRELYRLRWQVELVFKELKQHLGLESLPTKDRHAVLALAWASLLALAVSRGVASCFYRLRNLVGLQAALRPALLTRALRSWARTLGRAIVAPAHLMLAQLRQLVDDLLYEAKAPNPHRDDSLSRLMRLLPHGALA